MNRKKTLITIMSVILLVAAVILGYFYYRNATFAYKIPGVPYAKKVAAGEFQSANQSISYNQHMADRAFFMSTILSYWHQFDSSLPNPSFEELDKQFPSSLSPPMSSYIPYFQDLGFTVEYVKVSSLSDFKKYINSERRTPLVIYQDIAPETRYSAVFYPYRVVIGFDNKRRVFTVNDFWLGPHYEIPFDEFKELWYWEGKGAPQNERAFLAIYPPNYKELLEKDVSLASVERTAAMDEQAQLTIKFYRGKYLLMYKDEPAEAALVFESLLDDLSKANLALQWRLRILAYVNLANAYQKSGEYQKSIDTAMEAFGFVDKLPDELKSAAGNYLYAPIDMFQNRSTRWYLWKVIAEGYEQLKQYDKAIDAYRKAANAGKDLEAQQKIEAFVRPRN